MSATAIAGRTASRAPLLLRRPVPRRTYFREESPEGKKALREGAKRDPELAVLLPISPSPTQHPPNISLR